MSCFLAGLLFVCSVFNKLLHCISTGSWVATGTNVLSDFVILIPLQNFFCYIIFHSLICSYSSFGRCYAEPVNLIAVVPLGLIAPCIYLNMVDMSWIYQESSQWQDGQETTQFYWSYIMRGNILFQTFSYVTLTIESQKSENSKVQALCHAFYWHVKACTVRCCY